MRNPGQAEETEEMLYISQEKEPDQTLALKLSGSVTIESAEELKQTLSDVIEQYAKIKVEGNNMEAIDILGLQVLCSACRTAIQKDKELAWKNGIPELVKEACFNTGFSRKHGCGLCPEHIKCLWVCSAEQQE